MRVRVSLAAPSTYIKVNIPKGYMIHESLSKCAQVCSEWSRKCARILLSWCRCFCWSSSPM